MSATLAPGDRTLVVTRLGTMDPRPDAALRFSAMTTPVATASIRHKASRTLSSSAARANLMADSKVSRTR